MLETWQHECIHTNGINLHYVTQGEGPLMLMLHGFPEFWYSWRHQIPEFAQDYKVVAVDLRGYNDSDKPAAQTAYVMSEFVADIKGVIEGLGYEQCVLVGHDWGGVIAWNFAYAHPEMVKQLVVLNAPPPAVFSQKLFRSLQWLRSWYVLLFQIPVLSEFLIQLGDYKALEMAFSGMAIRKSAFTEEDLNIYKDALAKRGVLTAALSYYRNVFQQGLTEQSWEMLDVPTLIIWGEEDIALDKELTYGLNKYIRDLQIRYISNCSHWVQQEQPELVKQYIREFLVATLATSST
jgi:pimeloyl-ACP methyl ester carboxylesterase